MDSKTTFQDLTPNKEANSPVYDEAIKYALNNKSIRNVAISGAYGAGKSSVLLSYESRHKEKRFLHISLAHFEDTKEIQQEREKESVLEGKILNQLLHQLNQEDIPQTNFRVKREIAKRQIVFWSMVAVLYSLLWLFMVKYDSWCQYFNTLPEGGWHWLHFLTAEWMPIVIGIVIFLLSCFFLYKLLREQVNRGFLKKLSVKGNEIELFAQSEDSFFDKYLNEVLYLFSHAQADVIVFEDLDRFEMNRIFERLHEINTLVNQQREKDGKTPLKFFYLLRDDIFTSKDRTKFFDFIIPVVPVVDGSNSYDKLKEILEQNDCLERFEEHFLMDISLYIDEMRVLKNICNEFFVYIRSLNTTELDYNKMFALIVYKNLFPKDFGELQLNRGYVYSLFARKDQFIGDEILGLESEIDEKNKALIQYQKEIATNKSELDTIYETKKQPVYSYNLSPEDRAEYIIGV